MKDRRGDGRDGAGERTGRLPTAEGAFLSVGSAPASPSASSASAFRENEIYLSIRELADEEVESQGGHPLSVLGRYAPLLAEAKGKKVGRRHAFSKTEKAEARRLSKKGKSSRAIARIFTERRLDCDPRAEKVSQSTVYREVARAEETES